MGDLGGLFEALNYVFLWLLSPFTAYAFETRLISHIFRQSSIKNEQNEADKPDMKDN